MPRRIVTVLEGESLVNDASGLVLYKFAVAAVIVGRVLALRRLGPVRRSWRSAASPSACCSRACSSPSTASSAIRSSRCCCRFRFRTLPTCAAESVHVSGVLAVVAAGLLRGRYSPRMRVGRDAHPRALGVEPARVHAEQPDLHPDRAAALGHRLAPRGLLPAASSPRPRSRSAWWRSWCASRWVYFAEYLPCLVRRAPFGVRTAPPHPGEAFIVELVRHARHRVARARRSRCRRDLEWQPFPNCDLIIFLTFVVILVTLVVQGLTLAPSDPPPEARHRPQHAGRAPARARRPWARRRSPRSTVPPAKAAWLPDVLERIRAEFGERVDSASPLAQLSDSSHAHATRCAPCRGRARSATS